jgi:formylglycine-generating enzyme required for sulfatase activity
MKFVPVPGTEVLFGVWLTRVQDFEAFVTATGHDATKGTFSTKVDGTKARGDTWKNPGFDQGPTYPVCGVNWKDADAFCNWLTKKERVEGRLNVGQRYRLPQDWEWSVGVGLSEPRDGLPKDKDRLVGDIFPWGTQWPPPAGVANYAGEEVRDAEWPAKYTVIEGYRDGYARTSPVGSFAANQFGLCDMGGNVWQWCDDWYDSERTKRVLRGSSWRNSDPKDLLSSYRFNRSSQTRVTDFGFRCVLVK